MILQWETDGKEVWNEYYGDRKALNIGIGADRTQHVLWRLENGNIDGIDPKVTVVLIGTNNSLPQLHTTSEMLSGVQAVVEKLLEKLPDTEILLIGILPREDTFHIKRGRVTQVNQVLRLLDEKVGVHFLEFGHLYLNPDGSLKKPLMDGPVHLSEQGYRVRAEAMEPMIVELLDSTSVTINN